MAYPRKDTKENGWILTAWAQGALVSARAEVRKLRRQPSDRVALNELALALNGARRYASMAGHTEAEAIANETEDDVCAVRSAESIPTPAWMDEIERRIEAAEAALMDGALPGPGNTPEGYPRPLPKFRAGFAGISDWETLV
jgi:hypothetical protein